MLEGALSEAKAKGYEAFGNNNGSGSRFIPSALRAGAPNPGVSSISCRGPPAGSSRWAAQPPLYSRPKSESRDSEPKTSTGPKQVLVSDRLPACDCARQVIRSLRSGSRGKHSPLPVRVL